MICKICKKEVLVLNNTCSGEMCCDCVKKLNTQIISYPKTAFEKKKKMINKKFKQEVNK